VALGTEDFARILPGDIIVCPSSNPSWVPVFTIAGTLVFTTKHGTLDATLSGTLNVATGEFNASGPVSGGTGQLAGTTGNLTFHGFEDLSNGAFTETINGTLCQAGAGDDGEGD